MYLYPDITQTWCCDVHNIAANGKLDWRSAKERKTGYTPDISMFRFHLWEPIWKYEPSTKQPETSLKKARWSGIAHSAGDAMTYFIETERDGTSKHNVILVWSIISSRQKNIGTAAEFVNEDPALGDFFLSRPEMEVNKDDSMVDEVTAMNVIPDMVDQGELHNIHEDLNEDSRGDVDPREALPPGEADNEPPLAPEERESYMTSLRWKMM
jgi:hypothetical protein